MHILSVFYTILHLLLFFTSVHYTKRYCCDTHLCISYLKIKTVPSLFQTKSSRQTALYPVRIRVICDANWNCGCISQIQQNQFPIKKMHLRTSGNLQYKAHHFQFTLMVNGQITFKSVYSTTCQQQPYICLKCNTCALLN